MNKFNKFLFLSFFIFVCFSLSFADRTIVSSQNFKAKGRIIGNGINHVAITSISSIEKFLNAKVRINFGTAESVNIKLKYYVGNDSSTVTEVNKGNIYHNTPFFISTQIDANEGDIINYQLEALFTYRDATERTKTTTTTFCWPIDSSENPYYQQAVLTSSVVAVPSNGKVTLQSGDQSKTDTFITVPEEYSAKTFIIKELPLDDYREPSNAPANSSVRIVNPNKPVKLFYVGTTDDSSFENVSLNISYPELTSRDNFTLKIGTTESSITENVPVTSVDTNGKIVSAKINKAGYYALFTDIHLKDSDYRPAKRVIVKARAISRGDVFAFNYLKEGDSVKIYNVNGKKIRTITSGTSDGFTWDGKNDNGQYVESGTYVYQIKVKGRSKLISGTIAFVK